MGRLITIILILISFVGYSQTYSMKDSRSGDIVQRIIQTTKASGIVKYLLITGTDTAEIRWNGTKLLIGGYNLADSIDLTTDSIAKHRIDINSNTTDKVNNLAKTAVSYTPTDSDDYIIFTNTASGNDTCFLTGLETGKVLTILIGDGTNDVVINATTLTENGLTNITNYSLQNYVRSAIVIHEGAEVYHIMVIAN